MTADIDSSALAQLIDMGLPEGDAAECLKACGNDVARAVEYFFNRDAEKPQNNQWDQNAWNTSRDDANERDYNNSWNSNFLVQGPDQLPSETTNGNRYDGTKSRPPSPTNADTEDPELAEAMRLSMQSAPQQETGITTRGRSPVQLAPLNPNFNQAHANKEYNPQDWALTTTTVKPFAAEALPNDRKRSLNTPAFLRSTYDNYNLGGALTILHSIPCMRDLFLMRDHLQTDYGSNGRWWNGERIQVSRVIDLDNIRTDSALEVINEVQRLFAFLDGTERAYGSVEPLCDLPNMREANRLQQLATFMRNYEVAYRYVLANENVNLPWITSTGRLFENGTENEDRASSFQLLEVSVNASDSSLYSAIDNLIWDENEVAIDFNEVVILSVQQASGSPGTGVEIATELYLDRYTEPWLEQVVDLKKKIRQLRSEREAIMQRATELTQFHGEKPVEFLTETIRIYKEIILNEEFNILDDENTVPPENPIPSLERILNDLKTEIASIDAKHSEVNAQLTELHATYTNPAIFPTDAPAPLRHILRGITTGDSHTYLLRSREDDKPQWWSFTWNPDGDTWDPRPTHSTIPMTQAAVLQAAQTQGESVILFYATEEAMVGDKSLPEKLQQFVDRDNELFRKEMDPPPVYNMEEVRIDDEPVSPTGSGERKRTRDERDDSFSSNNGVVKRLSFSDEVEMIEKPGKKEVVKAMLKDQDDKEMMDVEHVEEVRKGG